MEGEEEAGRAVIKLVLWDRSHRGGCYIQSNHDSLRLGPHYGLSSLYRNLTKVIFWKILSQQLLPLELELSFFFYMGALGNLSHILT